MSFSKFTNQNCKKVIFDNAETVGCRTNQTVQILSPLILQALHCQHGKSVPGVASICLHHRPASARHGGYQMLYRLYRDGLPILLQHRKHSSGVAGGTFRTLRRRSSSSHKCSIGLRSGLSDGLGRVRMF